MISLFFLIHEGEFNEFKKKLDLNKINEVNEFMQGYLHEAIAYKRSDIGLFLINSGVDVSILDDRGQSALHYAALYNNIEIATEIVYRGGDVNHLDIYGNSPLWTATFNADGNYDIVKLLINSGSDPNHKNNAGRSPLDFAEEIGDNLLCDILHD